MATKNVKKQDGTGHGRRDNMGRGGCANPRKTGKNK